MRGYAIFVVFHLLGMGLESWLSIPLPANVIGLGLLTAALFMGIIKLEWVDASSRFTMRHMSLLFAPAIVGTMVFANVLGSQWLSIVMSVAFGALLTMLATGLVIRLWPDRRESHDQSQSPSA